MGQGDSKEAPPTSLHLFNEEERTTMQEIYRSMLTQTPQPAAKHHHSSPPHLASFASFQLLLGNLIPEELQQYIYANFMGGTANGDGLSSAKFVDGVARAMKGDRLHFYLSLFSLKGTDLSCHQVAKVLQYDATMWFGLSKVDPDEEGEYKANESDAFLKLAMQICFAIDGNQDQTTVAGLEKWAVENMKNLGDGLAYALQTVFKMKQFDFQFPRSLFESHILVSRIEAWLVYLISPHSSRKERDGKFSSSSWRQWQLLYSSQRDGWSVSRFCTKALDYKSHTLILIRDSKHRLFGGFMAEEWKLSPPGTTRKYFESPDCKECFLFSLQPVYQRLSATGVSHHHFMLICDSLTKGGGDTELIAMGGQVGYYRLCIMEGLSHGKCRKIGTSFKNGDILKLNPTDPDSKEEEEEFSIVGLELWGGGGEEIIRRQQELKKRDQDLAIRMRKVNRNLMFGVEDEKTIMKTDAVAQHMKLLEIAGVHTSHAHQGDHVM
eukprot:Phypoly_transcript_02446.p1 GENE.Phypoly_transcript_02446~~Phypoly_transcript_02446.p1  ORF type:complete len:493 (-),score=69.68 Phypoly_transcript_02446:126-1604(-)